ncbi:MAG: hypothetical protein PHE89_03515 [Alphaproteobacteria bacterium]|nr:hypothetical protein [Alphaproteobacteria bacterium]
MKKRILALGFVSFLLSGEAFAQATTTYMDEVKALGVVAGQGLACGSSKYDTFEMLARAIMITKAPSNAIQEQAMYKYNDEKANAYVSKQFDGFYGCDTINQRFDNQEIFQATLYRDGTIKMPDGKVLTPRQPYDVTLVYAKNEAQKNQAQAIYDGKKGQQAKNTQISVEGLDTPKTVQSAPKTQTVEPVYQDSVGRISRKKR